MMCEKLLGSVADYPGYDVIHVDIAWHEAFKKLHRKIAENGEEMGIRLDNDILHRGLRPGDVLFTEDETVYAVRIPACQVLRVTIAPGHDAIRDKVCYEIGNKHAALFWGETRDELITPYNAPLAQQLGKLHGVTVEEEWRTLDFDKAISSTINAHTH
jgi:urease accessory protein